MKGLFFFESVGVSGGSPELGKGNSSWVPSGMKQHIRDFVQWCLTCQQVKAKHQKPAGLLQLLKVVEWKWESMSQWLL